MMRRRTGRLRHLVLLWIAASLAIGLVTAVCFRLDVNLGATSYLFLIVIVLLSLTDSLISSLIFSVIAAACLKFFFAPPIFSFEIADAQDLLRIAAFFLTSIVITTLVRKLDRATEMQRHQARQLELTHDAIVSSDANGVIVYWNRAAEELYGWKREEALGKQPQILLQTEFPAPFEEIKDILARTGRWDGELGHTRRDGTKVRVSSRWSLQRDETGEPIGRITTNNDVTERKRAEEALLESERRFRVLVQGVTDYALFMLDPTGHVVNWNIGAQRIKGYGAAEIVGQHFSKFYTPEDIAAGLPDNGLATAARDGRYESEGWRLRKDGTRFWAAIVIDAIKDDNGKLIGFAKIARDITERREAEETLRRSEAAYLAEAQRLSETGSFGWNVATGELFWSDETFRIFGYDPATKPSLDLVLKRVHPDDLPRVRQVVEQATNDQQEVDLEPRLLMPDGTVKTVHVRAGPSSETVVGDRDTPVKPEFVGAVMDVTARTEAYAALQQTEQRYRYLFDHMPMALFQLRTRGRVRRGRVMERLRSEGRTDFLAYLDQHPEFVRDALDGLRIEAVNAQAIRMFGARDAGELIAMTNARIWRERPDTFRRVLESRFHRRWTYHEETRIRTLDGRLIDVLFTIARPEQADSDAGLILYGFIDITESVRTREKLQDVQAEFAHAARISMLGQLVASIAHEVSQPLATLASSGAAGLNWLDRDTPDIEKASVAMRRIVVSARRAGDIIARIRGMASRRAPQQASMPLAEVIEEALAFLRHELQSKQIEVSLDLAPALPPVLADRIQLQQVIVNLTINAVQAMAQSNTARRVLAVGTAQFDADKLICTLEDSGPGIAQEHLDRLFENFFTTKESGMGLGLAISRGIIEAHGGNLRVDNGSAYGGARFSFTLRTAPSDSQALRALG